MDSSGVLKRTVWLIEPREMISRGIIWAESWKGLGERCLNEFGSKGDKDSVIDLILDSPLKVTFNFLNGTLYFSLHIMAHLESFPKHYN